MTGKNIARPHRSIILGVSTVITNIPLCITLLTLSFLARDGQVTHEVKNQHLEVDAEKTLNVIKKDTTIKSELEQLQEDLSHYYGARKPSCHLEPALPPFTGRDGVETLYWMASSENTFVEDGLELVNGSVVVKTEGYYFIYSKIVYQGNGTEELDHGRIIHKVEKLRSGEKRVSPGTLLQNCLSTPSIRRGRQVYRTSTVEGTFFLEERSRVSVLSSVPRNIDFSPLRTYYGVFLM